MPFIIQGQDVAAVPETQSPWYETAIAILVAGIAGTGVLTGCEVTAQGSPNMTVAVASGTIQPSAGVASVAVTGANKTIITADGDDPRIDLVSASAAGVLTVTDGTAAPSPKPPPLPSGHIALAMVDVPATDTTIGTAQITDKRVIVFAASGGSGFLDGNSVGAIPFGTPPVAPVAGTVLLYADSSSGSVTLIPTMASATSPSGVASASTEIGSNNAAWTAMPGSGAQGDGHGWLNNGTACPQWIEYEFSAPQVIGSYSIRPWWTDNQTRTPASWTFEGYNGATWDVLDTRTSWNWLSDWTNYVLFTISSPASYTRYRVNISANGGNAYTSMGGLKMFGPRYSLYFMTSAGTIHEVT